jgi:hypothetical protein
VHRITSVIPWCPNVAPALAAAEAGGSIHRDEAAANTTNFSVMGCSWLGVGADWKPVQISRL